MSFKIVRNLSLTSWLCYITRHSGPLFGHRPSIDADFDLRMLQLGLYAHAQSMPYNSTLSGKTAAA